MVFAWFGSGGRPSQWDLPDEPPIGPDWCKLRSHTFRFRGHPQETTENSVDLGHLRYVHGYDNVNPVGSVSIDGAYLKSCFDFKSVRRILGCKVPRVRTLGHHPRLWPRLLLRRNPRENY